MTGENNNLDDQFIEEGVALLKQKLGADIYTVITITSQDQVLLLLEIIHNLEHTFDFKKIREWFLASRPSLDNTSAVEVVTGLWNVNSSEIEEIKRLSKLVDKE
jgi:hypothetical protein